VAQDPAARLALHEAVASLPDGPARFHTYLAATRYEARPPSPDLVLQAARSAEPRLRAQGLRDARWLRLPETRALALEAARKAEGADLQLALAEVLGPLADPEIVPALLATEATAAPAARGRTIDLLRPVRAPDTVAAVIAGLGDRSADVRALAAEVLAGIPLPAATAAIGARLARERQQPALGALVLAAGQHRDARSAAAIAAAARRDPKDLSLQQSALQALARIGFANPEVRAFFERCASGRDLELRLTALDVAGASLDPAAADLLLAAVADKQWQVRVAAVEGLGRVRVARAVPPLIARLEAEEHRRVRQALAETLFRLTGQNFYDIHAVWLKWWERAAGSGIMCQGDEKYAP